MRELWEMTFEEVYEQDKVEDLIYPDGYDPYTEYVIKQAESKPKHFRRSGRKMRLASRP
jgi:hypothetical protein